MASGAAWLHGSSTGPWLPLCPGTSPRAGRLHHRHSEHLPGSLHRGLVHLLSLTVGTLCNNGEINANCWPGLCLLPLCPGGPAPDVLHLVTDTHRGLLREGFLLSSFPEGKALPTAKGATSLAFPRAPLVLPVRQLINIKIDKCSKSCHSYRSVCVIRLTNMKQNSQNKKQTGKNKNKNKNIPGNWE